MPRLERVGELFYSCLSHVYPLLFLLPPKPRYPPLAFIYSIATRTFWFITLLWHIVYLISNVLLACKAWISGLPWIRYHSPTLRSCIRNFTPSHSYIYIYGPLNVLMFILDAKIVWMMAWGWSKLLPRLFPRHRVHACDHVHMLEHVHLFSGHIHPNSGDHDSIYRVYIHLPAPTIVGGLIKEEL